MTLSSLFVKWLIKYIQCCMYNIYACVMCCTIVILLLCSLLLYTQMPSNIKFAMQITKYKLFPLCSIIIIQSVSLQFTSFVTYKIDLFLSISIVSLKPENDKCENEILLDIVLLLLLIFIKIYSKFFCDFVFKY